MNLAFDEFGNEYQPPLIILHGFFASSRNWRAIAEKLATQFHVYVLDQRNHGASFHNALMDYPSMAGDLLDFITYHNLTSVNLLGHSMGGKVAMWFALNYPDYINKLIIADIAPISYQHCFDNTIHALQSLPLQAIHNRKQADDYLAEFIPELSYRQFLLQNLLLVDGHYQWRVNLDIFQQAAPAIVGFPDTSCCVPFTGDALFVAGAQSNFVKANDFSELFPTATLSVVEDAGHWLHVQQPIRFLALVQSFLQQG